MVYANPQKIIKIIYQLQLQLRNMQQNVGSTTKKGGSMEQKKARWYQMIFPCCFHPVQVYDSPLKESSHVRKSKVSQHSLRNANSFVNMNTNEQSNRQHYLEQSYHLRNSLISKNDTIPFLYGIEKRTLLASEGLDLLLPLQVSDTLIFYEIQKEPSKHTIDFIKECQQHIMIGINGDNRFRAQSKSFLTQEILGYNGKVVKTDYNIPPMEKPLDLMIIDGKALKKIQHRFDRVYLDPLQNIPQKDNIDPLSGRLIVKETRRLQSYLYTQLSKLSTHNLEIVFPPYVDMFDLVALFQQVITEQVAYSPEICLYNLVPHIQGIFDSEDNLVLQVVSFKESTYLPLMDYLLINLSQPADTAKSLAKSMIITPDKVHNLVYNCPGVKILRAICKIQRQQQSWISILQEEFGKQIAQEILNIKDYQSSSWIIMEEDVVSKTWVQQNFKPERMSCGLSQYSYTNFEASPPNCEIINSPQEGSLSDGKFAQSGTNTVLHSLRFQRDREIAKSTDTNRSVRHSLQ